MISPFQQYLRDFNIPAAEACRHFDSLVAEPLRRRMAAQRVAVANDIASAPHRFDLEDAEFLAQVAEEVADTATRQRLLDAALVIAQRVAGEAGE